MLSTKTVKLFAKGAMRAKPRKLMFAGVLAACAFGGIAMGIAWATDGLGARGVLIAGPVLLDEIDAKYETDRDEVELKTSGLWTSRIMHFHIPAGGHTGWHSHPGPVFVIIKAGTMTLEQSDGSSADYPPGTGFMEEPGRVHIARNEGDVELEFEAFILIPLGAPVRIDERAP